MVRNKIPRPMTISALRHYKSKNEIKNIEVQRDLVWVLSQKQLLIDSLFKDFDIPKIYFRDVVEQGKTIYYVIDGQQRLNAIFGFMNNEFPMPSDADPVLGEEVADKTWDQLNSDIQIEFGSRTLDTVHLVDYSDAEIEEMFLRLQNGTPLKAAEKRRAIAGNMRLVVHKLSEHQVFNRCCDFRDLHYAYEDTSAKVLKMIMENNSPANISAQALKKMYEQNSNITESNKAVKDTKSAFTFVNKAFRELDNPKLKKYAIMDLSVIASGMLKTYTLQHYAKEFGEAYLKFDTERILNKELPEDQQNPILVAYGNATRGDSLELISYRQKTLKEFILEQIPNLEIKDDNRLFTPDQRAVIYRIGKGRCAECGKSVSEDEFEADHIIPHSRGGKTKISNGQILCAECNRRKSDSISEENH